MLLFGSLLCGLPFGEHFPLNNTSIRAVIDGPTLITRRLRRTRCQLRLRDLPHLPPCLDDRLDQCLLSMGGFIATGVTTGTNQIQSNYVRFPSVTHMWANFANTTNS
jgi:hypothetical protein